MESLLKGLWFCFACLYFQSSFVYRRLLQLISMIIILLTCGLRVSNCWVQGRLHSWNAMHASIRQEGLSCLRTSPLTAPIRVLSLRTSSLLCFLSSCPSAQGDCCWKPLCSLKPGFQISVWRSIFEYRPWERHEDKMVTKCRTQIWPLSHMASWVSLC